MGRHPGQQLCLCLGEGDRGGPYVQRCAAWISAEQAEREGEAAGLSAAAKNDRELMTFYERRFAPEFRKVFDVWRSQYPADLRGQVREGPNVSMLHAEHSESLEATALRDESSALFSRAEKANSTGDRYVASTVILALVLFLLGISTVARSWGQRRLLVMIAGGLGLVALAFLFSLPMAAL